MARVRPTAAAAGCGSLAPRRPARCCHVVHGARVHNGTLYGVDRQPLSVLDGSPFFPASRQSLRIESPRAGPSTEACHERLHRAVIATVPGHTGCRQFGHFLYNFVMPLWDALRTLGWDAAAAEPPTVFVDCTGLDLGPWGGALLRNAPPYVATATRVLSSLPLRSLPDLLSSRAVAKRARSYSPSAALSAIASGMGVRLPSALCFDELLVGYGCANLDHYNARLSRSRLRQFRGTLARATFGELPWLPRTAGSAMGVRLLMVSRVKDRRILNERDVFDRVTRSRGISRGRSRLVRFEGLALHAQMRLWCGARRLCGLAALLLGDPAPRLARDVPSPRKPHASPRLPTPPLAPGAVPRRT